MSTKMWDRMHDGFTLLRHEPTEKRVRVRHAGRELADTTSAVLVWEPRRVVPSYALPVAELRADLVASSLEPTPVPDGILHPSIPFAAHSCAGAPVDLVAGDLRLAGVGFRPEDADLEGYVVLDFKAFDAWLEEDEQLVAHPREPYHWVDILPSSRTIRLELDGVVLAESSRPTLVFETSLPTRYYLPRGDVTAELTPSGLRTSCAYKGEAEYFSVAGHQDLAWSYPSPSKRAEELEGLVAFWDDKLDVYLDGRLREGPRNVLAETLLDEFDVAKA